MDLAEAIPSTQDELNEKTKRLHVIDDEQDSMELDLSYDQYADPLCRR